MKETNEIAVREKERISADIVSRIERREKLVEMAKNFTLMSDVFMSVALRDIPACQYVLRVLTGKKDLEITSDGRLLPI